MPLSPEEQRDMDGVHSAITLATAYLDRDMNTVQAILQMYRHDGVPLITGLAAAFDSLIRSAPGDPHEILQLLRGVALQTEAGGGR
ncbi:hypothetical protein [Mycolicibacter sinensis]